MIEGAEERWMNDAGRYGGDAKMLPWCLGAFMPQALR